jgi:hypothetical protein
VSAYVLSVCGAVVTLVLMVEMLRRRRMREKYAALWLVIGFGILIVGIFPGVLLRASDLLGVEVPANLLFFLTGIVLLLLSVQHSAELSKLEDETRTLAEEIALLQMQVRETAEGRPLGQEPGPPAT